MGGAISCGERKVPASGLQVQVSRVKKKGQTSGGGGFPGFSKYSLVPFQKNPLRNVSAERGNSRAHLASNRESMMQWTSKD